MFRCESTVTILSLQRYSKALERIIMTLNTFEGISIHDRTLKALGYL